jgi:hypothetical protein
MNDFTKITDSDHGRHEAHSRFVAVGPSEHPAMYLPHPSICAPGAHPFTDSDQNRFETQGAFVAVGPLDPSAMTGALLKVRSLRGRQSADGDQQNPDAHISGIAVGNLSSQSSIGTATIHRSHDGWLELRVWAEMLHDAQKARIAADNRALRGGVDPSAYAVYLEALARSEHECELNLKRCYRRVVPAEIVAWQKRTVGIGDKLLARLLGHLGHPVMATPHHWRGTGSNRVLVEDAPYRRTVGQLWQYCGHGAHGRVRKGISAEELAAMGSPTLKMLVHLNAESCMKQRTSPYRLVYEEVKASVEDKRHTVECVRCGPAGKPAQPGTPWNAGHKHAHALRLVGKEILRDLWLVAGGADEKDDRQLLDEPIVEVQR